MAKKNNLQARLKAWNEMRAEGGKGNMKMVRNGKLSAYHMPGSQKK